MHKPIVIGNSIGGAAAIHFATRQEVAALVLCNTGGLTPSNSVTRGFCKTMSKVFNHGAPGPAWYKWFFSAYYNRLVLPSKAAQSQRQRIVAACEELAPILASAWHHFADDSADLRATVATLRVPIWLAWARHDRIIPLWMCRPAIAKIPNHRLSLFDGGHAAFLEQPDDFFEGFVKFAAGLEQSAS